jgi:hypothetical protein
MTQSAAQVNVYNHVFKKMKTLSNEIKRLKGYDGKFTDDVYESTDETLTSISAGPYPFPKTYSHSP